MAKERAAELRRDGWTLKRIAAELGVTVRTISRWLPAGTVVLTEEQKRANFRSGQREAALAARPPEAPGVLWVSTGGTFLRARVDMDDWARFRALSFWASGVGYAAARVDGRTEYLHRLILNLSPDERWPDGERKVVDHLNRDRLDCRKANMRVCTQKENCANRGGPFESAAA